jgi:hypothetical protein
MSLIAKFYEEELGIPLTEEREIFNNFKIKDIRDLRRIPVDQVFKLNNWTKINLTELQEFDILMYTRKDKLSHFSMYVGNYKVLDVREGQHSMLRHLSDTNRSNIAGIFRSRQLVTKLSESTL